MDALTETIAREVGYEWSDNSTAMLLLDYIEEGEAFLIRYDPKADFNEDKFIRGLLVEYVRYALANARDDFKRNYAEEILYLSHMGRVKNATEETDNQ